MKKIIVLMLIAGCWQALQAQQTTTTNSAANPNTNNAVGTATNNSNSGVNAAGNPGTIINSTANSTATSTVNTDTVPRPVISNTNVVDTVPNKTDVLRDTSASYMDTMNRTQVTDQQRTVTMEPNMNTNFNWYTGPVTLDIYAPGNNAWLTSLPEGQQTGLTRFAALPQLVTFVPDHVVTTMKQKYGNSLYDITMVKAVGGGSKYVVRSLQNGQMVASYHNEDGSNSL